MAGTKTTQKIEIDEAGEITATLGDAVFKITPGNKVTAYTTASLESKPALGAPTDGVLCSIGKDFTFAAYGTKIVPTATGFTVYADSIALRHANENKALKAHKVGEHLDGTVCIDVDLKNDTAVFAPEGIFGGDAKFDDQDRVVEEANRNKLHGHGDWRRTTDVENEKLSIVWNKVAPQKLQGLAAPSYWGASADDRDYWAGRVWQGGQPGWCVKDRDYSCPVPVVFSVPAWS